LSKSKAKPATSKTVKTAKSPSQTAAPKKPAPPAKPKAKAPAKPAAKATTKVRTKATTKERTKPKPLATTKPKTKAAAKPPVKGSGRPVGKPAAKGASKSAPKPARKPPAKAASKPSSKPPAKSSPKRSPKLSGKTSGKASGKASGKTSAAPKSAKNVTGKSPAKRGVKIQVKTKPTSTVKLVPAPAVSKTKTAAPSAPGPVHVKKASVKATAAPATSASAPYKATESVATTARPAGKTRMSRAQANSQPVPAAPIHPANRFADRFAPAKSSARHLPEPILDIKPAGKPDPKLAKAWKSKAGRDLSEPELLAMPGSEYMNDKQIDFFKSRLSALKEDLLSNAGETTEHLREDTTIVPDPADRATIEEEHALELRTRDRERKLLRKISQSLARIDTGEYGYCEETGEPIGLGRLLARPTATLSLEAQQRRELKQRMFGN